MRYLKDALWMKSSLQVPPPSLHAVAAVGGGAIFLSVLDSVARIRGSAPESVVHSV